MGGISRVYQTQGLFIISAPDTDVTENNVVVHEQQVTEKKNPKFLTWLKSVILLFYALFSELTTWTSFRFSCINFIVHFYYPTLRLHFR